MFMTNVLRLDAMNSKRWIRKLVGAAALVAATAGVVPTSVPGGVAQAAEGLGAGGEYHPLPPKRKPLKTKALTRVSLTSSGTGDRLRISR